VRSVLAGANNGLLQAEAKKHMDGLGQAARDVALAAARAFREKHRAGSSGALAAFDKLSTVMKFAARILASITGGAVRRGCVVASSLRQTRTSAVAVVRVVACR
jgi:hypothetical protein